MLFGFDNESDESPSSPAAGAPAFSRDTERATSTVEPGHSRSRLFGLLGLLLGMSVVAGAWALWPEADDRLTQGDVDRAIEDALEERSSESAMAAEAYALVEPSLVVVRAIREDGETSSLGGGVFINEQGQILTAHHVVVDASSIELTLADGTTAVAEIESMEPERDVALLRTQGGADSAVPAVVGNSRTLEIGDPIFAVGNPLGLTSSLSAGIVSGLDRDIPSSESDDVVFEGLIQFDAAVSQGSSGGPLLNAEGQVIGIVTSLPDPTGEGVFAGIGFAVPIDIALGVAADEPSQ